MAENGDEKTDDSSIKPVSSLRSLFENAPGAKRAPSTTPRSTLRHASTYVDKLESADDARSRADGRISLDMARPPGPANTAFNSSLLRATHLSPTTRAPQDLQFSSSKPRPLSMGPMSPPRSPPKVTVDSPNSPTKKPNRNAYFTPARYRPENTNATERHGTQKPLRTHSPSGARHFRIPSRATTPFLESHHAPSVQPVASAELSNSSKNPLHAERDTQHPALKPSPIPPPINRAGKPKIPANKLMAIECTQKDLQVPLKKAEAADEGISPFSTPPSSDTSPHNSPPFADQTSKPRHNGSKYTASSRSEYFPQSIPQRHDQKPTISPSSNTVGRAVQPTKSKYEASSKSFDAEDGTDERPDLPPRRELTNAETRNASAKLRPRAPEPPPPRRSMDTMRPPPIEQNQRHAPAPQRNSAVPYSQVSALNLAHNASTEAMKSNASLPYDSDDVSDALERTGQPSVDYPNSSEANRRPPLFRKGPSEIPTKYESKLFGVCGDYICTTGYVTRVWDVLTGQILVSLSHGETVKVTAMAFRPAADVEDEGKRIWLGTNIGEIHEIDVPNNVIAQTKRNAHTNREILKMYRCAAEMWTVDDDGKLQVWPSDESGSPSLNQMPHSFRVPKGHTFSIVAGSCLWYATGREIRVFQRDSVHHTFAPLLQTCLSQTNVGEVTSGAMIPSQPDRIYFGHNDGKVTIYDRSDYTCLGVVNVSVYKISSLAGIGDYLWAGYYTGMIYVYDTRCTPWKVKKDWVAHDKAIHGVSVDRTSIWKLGRLQVASFGADNMLRLWDGMLQDDWLDDKMQQCDQDYCNFREISAVVMTWNAGASKPTSLRHDPRGTDFFKNLLTTQDTVKSFFKSKKKDSYDQEHIGHQYRAWRDHLVRCIDDYMPTDTPYVLLHSSNLVGLFTCVFVKASERSRIREVCGAEVKLGMGGLHGNKGALIVRFILDDTSMCLINCHLAAGQTQTAHRNKDIAQILEASALPFQRDETARSEVFVGGGDGSMILDHEICILNGDLNYRIDAMGPDAVKRAVQQNNLAKLLERDQLLLSRKRNPGFRLLAFNESPITFAPTYKYDVGTDTYDTSEKKRSPAWCDRLLYRGRGRIRQLDYKRHEVMTSDHRPVSGRFNIRVKMIDKQKRGGLLKRCEKEFEQVKQRIAMDIKLDYLVNVFGLSHKEAKKLLLQ
ncbi:DNase I-like protein [Pseudovirgaria hyperparasitica]|uniref:DNase I-like protein n=1 Tax=Pseudovirgaria hyperparasitica TaxID=470096 RepID=A0A6A6VYA7_9PEZI|nr:DNase I-like protein [Pseudovirgaria hyperparasitica]KAF2754694.1 DNase I-like protein [Pseudovirgaria hyperparasitica]